MSSFFHELVKDILDLTGSIDPEYVVDKAEEFFEVHRLFYCLLRRARCRGNVINMSEAAEGGIWLKKLWGWYWYNPQRLWFSKTTLGMAHAVFSGLCVYCCVQVLGQCNQYLGQKEQRQVQELQQILLLCLPHTFSSYFHTYNAIHKSTLPV